MEEFIGNAVVGQSGGPTAAINATLSGVIRGVFENGDKIKTLYGMKNGIEGFVKEDLLDLSSFFDREEKLLSLEETPSSALGSCRLKLPDYTENAEVYEKIFSIIEKYNIRYFFYIGGNDSMDTVLNLDKYAKKIGYKIKVIGIPKTIDNDLMITDHTPGYGSAAKFVATSVKEIARDCSVYTLKAVTVVEIMGRDSGWLTAAAALPLALSGEGADFVYLPERTFDSEKFIKALKSRLDMCPHVVVAVSEGIKYANGRYVAEGLYKESADAFGHKILAGAARSLENLIKKEIGCKVRAVELNLPQRCSAHLASLTDINESIEIGKGAVCYSVTGNSGVMMTFKRNDGEYSVSIVPTDVREIANKVKFVPDNFINENGDGVTDACIEYIKPLINGERQIKYENGLPVHLIIK